MTHNEAVSAIALLKERQDLTRDEMCKGFQIALALFDDELFTIAAKAGVLGMAENVRRIQSSS